MPHSEGRAAAHGTTMRVRRRADEAAVKEGEAAISNTPRVLYTYTENGRRSVVRERVASLVEGPGHAPTWCRRNLKDARKMLSS